MRQDLVKETCKILDELGTLNINVVNPDLNYDFRYKTDYTGFYDTATHLITSRTNNSTENVNMNLIFLNQDTENAEKHAAHLARIHLNCLSYGLELMHQLLHRALRDFYDDKGFEKFKDKSLKAAEILIFDEVVLCSRCSYPAQIEHPIRLTVE